MIGKNDSVFKICFLPNKSKEARTKSQNKFEKICLHVKKGNGAITSPLVPIRNLTNS